MTCEEPVEEMRKDDDRLEGQLEVIRNDCSRGPRH